jgi:hypothetical protein
MRGMKKRKPTVYVENLPEKGIAEVLLRPYAVEIVNRLTSSAALGSAQYSLLTHPDHPVALLVNAGTDNLRAAAQDRDTIKRLLASCHYENWYVALAVPNLEAWALTDPRIRNGMEPYLKGDYLSADRAARIVELARDVPFDPTELLASTPDFRGLVEFLRAHAPDSRQRPASAAG